MYSPRGRHSLTPLYGLMPRLEELLYRLGIAPFLRSLGKVEHVSRYGVAERLIKCECGDREQNDSCTRE